MKILINGVGGPTPRSVARSIRESARYRDSLLVGVDANPFAHGLYEAGLYDDQELIPPACDPLYWEAIERQVECHGIEAALVHPELEVLEWTRRRSEGGDWPCQSLLPDHELVQLLIDKSRLTKVLQKTPWVPDSVEVDPHRPDWGALEAHLPYPFWIRATTGSSGLGSLRIEDREGLANWIHINPGVKRFLASTYLPGRNLGCKLLYADGELVRAASAERVNYMMSNVSPSGVTGNTSFGRLLNDPELVRTASQIMDALFDHTGAARHGFFTADFKEDTEGRPILTEINVRMVAFNHCFARAGANFTEDMLRILEGDPTFDRRFKMYEFEPGTIFLRDVDSMPILMNERELKSLSYKNATTPVS